MRHQQLPLSQESTNMAPTNQELVLQFMIALASNSNVHHTDIVRIARILAMDYLATLG